MEPGSCLHASSSIADHSCHFRRTTSGPAILLPKNAPIWPGPPSDAVGAGPISVPVPRHRIRSFDRRLCVSNRVVAASKVCCSLRLGSLGLTAKHRQGWTNCKFNMVSRFARRRSGYRKPSIMAACMSESPRVYRVLQHAASLPSRSQFQRT